jgi:tRNA-dihydrouridine synthase B
MIGRAAQGRPWIFREIAHFLATGEELPPPDLNEVKGWLLDHLEDHYNLYGEYTGVRSARKHLGWYALGLPLPAGAAAVFRHPHQRAHHRTGSAGLCARETSTHWASAHATTSTTTREDNWKLAA